MRTYTTRWMPGNRRTKYGAKKTVTGGRKYDSKMEATYAQQLELRKLAKDIADYVPQFRVGIYIGGSLWRKWKVDFKVIMNDGSEELHEVKGFETSDYQMKRDAFLKVMDSDCECNYIKEVQSGKKLTGMKLVVIK